MSCPELVCSRRAANSCRRRASTFFRSKGLTVGDNVLQLGIIASSFWEDDEVHLWEDNTALSLGVNTVASVVEVSLTSFLHLESLVLLSQQRGYIYIYFFFNLPLFSLKTGSSESRLNKLQDYTKNSLSYLKITQRLSFAKM